jgi:glycerate 2-kinase
VAPSDSTPHSSLRNDILKILEAATRAVDPHQAVLDNMQLEGDRLRIGGKTYTLPGLDRILVVGGGKAGTPMAAAVYEVLGDRIEAGAVNVKYGHTSAAGGWRVRYGRGGEPNEAPGWATTGPVAITEAGHPVPDAAGLAGAQRIAALLSGLTERDLVLVLI